MSGAGSSLEGGDVGSGTITTRMRVCAGAAVALLALVGLSACGSSSKSSSKSTTTTAAAGSNTTPASSIQTIDVTAKDFSFAIAGQTGPAPATYTANRYRIHLTNTGTEDHQAQLARVNDGVTQQQLMAAAAQSPDNALKLVSLVGGPNTIPPGGSQDVVVDLTNPGNYLMLCFVTSPIDHKPHIAKGMVLPFTVTAATGAEAAAPKSDGTVKMSDYQFELPSNVGHGTFKVINDGPQPHEMSLIKLAPGKTVSDVLTFLQATTPSGPPPFTSAGGAAGIQKGGEEWVTLDLQPGSYAAICFIPDAKDGKPHFAHGMVFPFTVK